MNWKKYKLKQNIVEEELRLRIKAKSGKITRYNHRINQYQQNRQFKNNGGFYKQLNNEGAQVEMKYRIEIKQGSIGQKCGVQKSNTTEKQSG